MPAESNCLSQQQGILHFRHEAVARQITTSINPRNNNIQHYTLLQQVGTLTAHADLSSQAKINTTMQPPSAKLQQQPCMSAAIAGQEPPGQHDGCLLTMYYAALST
jgi:hypothetical protein